LKPIKSPLIIIFAAIIFLFGCSKQSSQDKVLRMNLGSEPPTLDWNLANDSTSFDIISNIMIGLTRFALDENENIIVKPGVSDSWEITNNNTQYIFHLNPNAQWTDGKKVTAQDFVDSFQRLLDPELAAPYADLLSIIDLEQTKATDDQTLFIKLKRPAAYFIYLTAYGLSLPIRKDLIEKYGRNWTEPGKLVTNGPFYLSDWHHEYKISLKRSSSFHQRILESDPLYTKLVQELKYFMIQEQSSAFNLYENNSLDWIDNRSIPLSVMKKIKDRAQKIPVLRNTYIGFNHQKKPFDDLNLRKAFSYAIDRKALVEIIGKGDLANNTWIPPSLGQFFDLNQIVQEFEEKYNLKITHDDYQRGFFPKLAKKFLAESKYSKEDLQKIKFRIPNIDSSKILAETLQAMWLENLGIKVQIETMEWKVFLSSLRDDTPDIYRLNWGADYPDPDTFTSLFTLNNQINYGQFQNKEYNELSILAGTILDLDQRKKLYTKAESILTLEQNAIIPLFIDTQTILKKDYVKGLKINAMDISFLDEVIFAKNASENGV
jgi:oligopeptide transport system substrate-binding protein